MQNNPNRMQKLMTVIPEIFQFISYHDLPGETLSHLLPYSDIMFFTLAAPCDFDAIYFLTEIPNYC